MFNRKTPTDPNADERQCKQRLMQSDKNEYGCSRLKHEMQILRLVAGLAVEVTVGPKSQPGEKYHLLLRVPSF